MWHQMFPKKSMIYLHLELVFIVIIKFISSMIGVRNYYYQLQQQQQQQQQQIQQHQYQYRR